MIYNLFELENQEIAPQQEAMNESVPQQPKDRWFSALAARLFFALLLIADVVWGVVSAVLLCIGALGVLFTGGKVARFVRLTTRMRLSVCRAAVCGVSLILTMFSPAFGIMVACTYFLMYDPKGIEEVVPQSLQMQFKDYFQHKNPSQ